MCTVPGRGAYLGTVPGKNVYTVPTGYHFTIGFSKTMAKYYLAFSLPGTKLSLLKRV